MRPFRYTRAETLDQAVALIAQGAVPLAGGTNLIDHLRLGVRQADHLVDITRLDLAEITSLDDGAVRIGALVRNSDLAAHPLIRNRFPFITQALVSGASGQLRAMATVGGNLLQRTRCVYFQDLNAPCNKREPGSGCSAVEGFGRYNAILDVTDACVAVHPSDLCIALAALDTVVVTHGPGGERRSPFAELHRLAGQTPWQDTNLDQGELITAIEIPALAAQMRTRYRKVRERASYAFATVSVAVALEVRDGTVHDVRIGLGGVSHRPHRAHLAEAALQGAPAVREEFQRAANAELADAQPGSDNAYKVAQLRNTLVAVLAELATPAREGVS